MFASKPGGGSGLLQNADALKNSFLASASKNDEGEEEGDENTGKDDEETVVKVNYKSPYEKIYAVSCCTTDALFS